MFNNVFISSDHPDEVYSVGLIVHDALCNVRLCDSAELKPGVMNNQQ